MKKVLFLFTLLVSIQLVSAAVTETINLKKDESFIIEGINVTLLDLNEKEDKVKICVNSRKAIVSNEKTINKVTIEIKYVKENYARLKLRAKCDDCVCDTEECSNIACYNKCEMDNDCNDHNENTIDTCSGFPKKCMYSPIEQKKEEIPSNTTTDIPQNATIKKEETPEKKPKSILQNLVLWIISKFK